MAETTIVDAERQAITFHAQVCSTAENLWVDGINLLLRALDPLSGMKTTSDEQSILLALVIRAWNTLYCAHDLSIRGYYSQALNLLRTPLEDWMAYWYLCSFPEEHVKFRKFQNPSDPSTKPPVFNEMLQAIESKHKQPMNTEIRDWMKRLHVFSHVSGSGVVMVISNTASGLHYHLGPTEDAEAFNLCASESATIITALLEAVDNLRLLMGASVYGEWPDYKRRVVEWQKSLILMRP